MLNKNDIQRLAQLRLDDAIYLYRRERASSAYYLAGYAVELAIKACAAKLFQPNSIPDKNLVATLYTHNLDQLMSASGLQPALKEATKHDSLLAANWGVVSKWNEASRYKFWDTVSAASLISAIKDPDHGVFTWVKGHW